MHQFYTVLCWHPARGGVVLRYVYATPQTVKRKALGVATSMRRRLSSSIFADQSVRLDSWSVDPDQEAARDAFETWAAARASAAMTRRKVREGEHNLPSPR